MDDKTRNIWLDAIASEMVEELDDAVEWSDMRDALCRGLSGFDLIATPIPNETTAQAGEEETA